MKKFSIVVAMDEARGIGQNGRLPWHLPADLKQFKSITSTTSDPAKKNAVIMGRKTWESLPEQFRPLPGRVNAVLTSQKDFKAPGASVFTSFDQALTALEQDSGIEGLFAIGGAQLFTQIIHHPQCSLLYVTFVQDRFPCDTFFPPIPMHFKEISRTPMVASPSPAYSFAVFGV